MKISEKLKIEKMGKFFLMTKILEFAAICYKKRFSEWTYQYVQKIN